MTAESQQVVSAYESGLSVEDIAAQLDYEVEAVKATLGQFSSQYRENAKEKVSLKFTENEQEEAKQTITRVMQNTEDDNLRLRAAIYIRDDAEGRLDNPLKGLKNINVTISVFNQQLLLARKAKERSRTKEISERSEGGALPYPSSPTITVESELVNS